jgi:hypothetical protein
MKKILVLLSSACLLIITACSSTPKITTDYNPDHNFGTIKTFHLVDKKRANNDLVNDRIISAINNYMGLKGVTATSAEQADMLVDFMVVTKDKTRVTSYNTGYGYGGYAYRGAGGRRGYGMGMSYGAGNDVSVKSYTEGSLVIDLIDPAEKKVLWRGMGSATLKERSPEERTELINRYTDAIITLMPL